MRRSTTGRESEDCAWGRSPQRHLLSTAGGGGLAALSLPLPVQLKNGTEQDMPTLCCKHAQWGLGCVGGICGQHTFWELPGLLLWNVLANKSFFDKQEYNQGLNLIEKSDNQLFSK